MNKFTKTSEKRFQSFSEEKKTSELRYLYARLCVNRCIKTHFKLTHLLADCNFASFSHSIQMLPKANNGYTHER